ncbi:MAG: MATE family efflux transporter [bacterium]
MKRNNNKLGEEKVGKLLLNLSLPATMAMMGSAIYNFADTVFIGKWVGDTAIGGLAITFPIQTLISAFSHLIGIGAASALSRYLGQGNQEKVNRIGGNSFLLLILLGLLIAVFGTIFVESIVLLFGATETILPYAKDYITIIFLGNVFFSLALSGNDLIRAEGNARIAMYSMFIGASMNIILDPIFIYFLNMGVKGAAIATIIAQSISFIYVVAYFYSGKSSLQIRLCHLRPDLPLIKEMVAVGAAPFIRHVADSLVGVVINNSLVLYGGDLALSTYGIINRLLMFKAMPLFGVIQGMQPIIGFNCGAGKYQRVKEAISLSLIVNTVIGTVGFALAMLFPQQIIGFFTSDQTLLDMGQKALKITISMVPVIGVHVVGTGLFQALGRAKISFGLALLRKTFLLIPLVLILPKIADLGLMGVWAAFPISDLLATVITFQFIRRENTRFNRLQSVEMLSIG